MTNTNFKERKLKEFREGIKSWIAKEGPYWPDWDKVEQFLSTTIDEAEKEKKQEVLKDVKERMTIAFKFIPDKSVVESLTDVLDLQLKIIGDSD